MTHHYATDWQKWKGWKNTKCWRGCEEARPALPVGGRLECSNVGGKGGVHVPL